jgi:hypothetical protein
MDRLLDCAANYMLAAIVEPDAGRSAALAEAANGKILELVHMRTGVTGELVPANAVYSVWHEVGALVRERLLATASAAAPALAEASTEADAVRIMTEAFSGLSIRQ